MPTPPPLQSDFKGNDMPAVPPRHLTGPTLMPIVGIGASAGGLDAIIRLVSALPVDGAMAYIIVQHLEPTHKSLMVELLAEHTAMSVMQATQDATIEADHIYVIPPGSYISVVGGSLHLSKPTARHGARMPVDFLFASMAKECGDRAIAIIMSGTGTDGTIGAKAVRDGGGFVFAQDPIDSEYDGMPRSAIANGRVDVVLSVENMPAALLAHARGSSKIAAARPLPAPDDALQQIIDVLRRNTPHDFTLYKMGTLQRRIERRMALASIPATDMTRYLALLQKDTDELNLLATDLLINVTGFFRDPKVFELLADTIVPDIVRKHMDDSPLRIWIAGCSTGEEAYSLAMIFDEAISAAKRTIRLCVFASDVDPDAVATAREGQYPDTISADILPERLARYFVRQDHGYSIAPDLRATIVFTVQDLLADPPFSKLDLISCRNLLIYLGPEAQTKAIALFHFALRPGGILLLGTSETIGHAEGRFETVAKTERIYRRIGKNRPGALLFSTSSGDGLRVPARSDQPSAPARQPALAEICRRLVLESYAPATVLINRRYECLYSMGPTERYLRVAPGYPSFDLLAMASPALRIRLRTTIDQITPKTPHLVATGGRFKHDGSSTTFDIDIRSVMNDGEELLMVGFIDRHGATHKTALSTTGDGGPRIADLEHELDIARTDLSAAIHDLEISGEEHRVVNEEALSVNEEYQSANEELLTSKEELQSLNEELTALNGQLQETLERQRTTSNDLQNVLYSTDVATLFLDTDLKIRFFTPATKELFSLIPGDVGRPLADLRSLSTDPTLADDARMVLNDGKCDDREVEAAGDIWFMRRILPYRVDDGGVEGVVITFINITERKTARKALEIAKAEAEQANLAKSRFLAAASHDLRQPLQSLALLQGLLVAKAQDEGSQRLLERVEQTLTTMSGMLNTMLDINQIEAGVIRVEPLDFVVGDLIERARREFIEQAQDQKLDLRVVACSEVIHSDPKIMKQMLRNLISNALKYTKRGKILIGCRRRGQTLTIEIWDTGVGIAASQLDAIFEEYHQIDNAARQRSLGLGLGLSIVQRLGTLLGHKVRVRSKPGRGSVFSIDVELPITQRETAAVAAPVMLAANPEATEQRAGKILIVDDDPELLHLLEQFFIDEGHQTAIAPDGETALAMVRMMDVRPDLMLADYNLPGRLNGLQLSTAIRESLGSAFPVVILTGDISTTTLRDVAAQGCLQLNKPVKLGELNAAIQSLLGPRPEIDRAIGTIYIVDDDNAVRVTLRELLEADGRHVEDFTDCETFLAAYRSGGQACLLIDAYLPGIDGIALLRTLKGQGHPLPAIMITGSSAVPMAVEAMKVGAIDFLEKPVGSRELLASIDRALDMSRDATKLLDWQTDAATHINGLTSRQHQVMDMVLAGHPSKNIAADLKISQRTVENHRAAIMKKTGTTSLPALARLALAATGPRPSD